MKALATLLLWCAMPLAAQSPQSCPMHKEHVTSSQEHSAGAQKRGDEAMGFPHDKTTHHFRLYRDGGAIEVTANDSNDSENVQAIRSHLAHIAAMFTNGDFSTPMFIHDQVPPGAAVMKKRRNEISYVFEELPAGGRVRIKAKSQEALRAVHQFLRFQVEDHHTGDSTVVSSERTGLVAHLSRLWA